MDILLRYFNGLSLYYLAEEIRQAYSHAQKHFRVIEKCERAEYIIRQIVVMS